MRNTTAGQLFLNEALPENLRDYDRVWDGKSTTAVLRDVAQQHPEKYRDVSFRLLQLGTRAAQETGGMPFGLRHMRKSMAAVKTREKIQQQLQPIVDNDQLTPAQRQAAIVAMVQREMKPQQEAVYQEALAAKNPLALQILSGSRGNKMNLCSLLGSDLLYSDHHDRSIPIPILRSYSEGLSPEEYFAGAYGARKGTTATKFCLDEEELVLMADWSVRALKDVLEGDLVMTLDEHQQLVPTRVVKVFVNGERHCHRYYFREGRSQAMVGTTATAEHGFYACYRNKSGELCQRMLPLGDATRGRRSAVVPLGSAGSYSEPLAGLLGALLGDGGLSQHNTNFYCDDPAAVNYFRTELEEQGFTLDLTDDPEDGADRYTVHEPEAPKGTRGVLRQWLAELGLLGLSSPEKFIPPAVWEWDFASCGRLAAWLLETDGCLTTATNQARQTYPVISFYVTSQRLASDFRRLLQQRLGIYPGPLHTRRVQGKPYRFGNREGTRKHNLHGFLISRRSDVARVAALWHRTGIKSDMIGLAIARKLRFYANDLPRRFVYATDEGMRPTRDLEVEHPSHRFVLANLLVVSNSTQDAGFFGKQLNQVNHRLVVTGEDYETPEQQGIFRGVPVDTNDMDNEGALLAHDVGPYRRNTLLTPKILKHITRLGHPRIAVRSAMCGGSPEGGVYARDVGVMEKGLLPGKGEMVGSTAAQALAEPISQGQLCLAAGTLVRMADWSVKKIEAVQPDEMALGSDQEGRLFPVRVVRLYENGLKPCVRTVFGVSRTKERIELISTLKHRLLSVARRWAPHTELADRGVWPVGERCVRLCGRMPTDVADAGGRPEPLALLFGLLLGDGCYTPSVHGNHLSCFDPVLVADIGPYLESLGLRIKLLAGQRGYYRISQVEDQVQQDPQTGRLLPGDRHPLTRALKRRGLWGKYAHEKEIPADVWGWNRDSLLNLLAGLFVATDGSVYINSSRREQNASYIGYSTASVKMAEQVRELLRVRLGIWPSPISSYLGKRKRRLYQVVITRSQDVLRLAGLLVDRVPGVKKLALRAVLENTRWTSSVDTRYFYRKQQVEIGDCLTYDLEVDHPAHLFVLANGLIVSNSAKHSGGVSGEEKAVSGFDYINQLVQVPKQFKGGAAHAQLDGTVQRIEPGLAGGQNVTIDGQEHHVGEGFKLKVKKWDKVEAGDLLSEGIPNPAEIVKHKGVGEGRRYFVQSMREAMNDAGLKNHRRNLELLSRGLINHVRLNEEYGQHVAGDVIPYSTLEHVWEPREGHEVVDRRRALGKYLEKPVLHYTIGTKVRPGMMKDLEDFGVHELTVHPDPPPFEPEMIRGMYSLAHDPDWQTRFYGSGHKKSLLQAVHRGDVSEERGTSFVPSLMRSVDFGRDPQGAIHPPGPGFEPPRAPEPVEPSPAPIGGLKTAMDIVMLIKRGGSVNDAPGTGAGSSPGTTLSGSSGTGAGSSSIKPPAPPKLSTPAPAAPSPAPTAPTPMPSPNPPPAPKPVPCWETNAKEDPLPGQEQEGGVGAAGFWESLIPVWGAGRAAINSFQQGNWGQGLFNSAMALADVGMLLPEAVAGATTGGAGGVATAGAWTAAKAAMRKGLFSAVKTGVTTAAKNTGRSAVRHIAGLAPKTLAERASRATVGGLARNAARTTGKNYVENTILHDIFDPAEQEQGLNFGSGQQEQNHGEFIPPELDAMQEPEIQPGESSLPSYQDKWGGDRFMLGGFPFLTTRLALQQALATQ